MSDRRNYFKSVVYQPETTIVAGQKGVLVEWLFDDLGIHEIARKDNGTFAIKPGCGCTADIEVLSDRILAKYNDSTVLAGKTKDTVGKTLQVFLNDGKPLFVKNEKGVKIWNPSKTNALLSFTLKVEAPKKD